MQLEDSKAKLLACRERADQEQAELHNFGKEKGDLVEVLRSGMLQIKLLKKE